MSNHSIDHKTQTTVDAMATVIKEQLIGGPDKKVLCTQVVVFTTTLDSIFAKAKLTGSALFGDWKPGSDIDFIVLTHEGAELEKVESVVEKLGFQCNRSDGSGSEDNDKFTFFRHEYVNWNLIVTTDKESYRNWLLCDMYVESVGLPKADRPTLYDNFVDQL